MRILKIAGLVAYAAIALSDLIFIWWIDLDTLQEAEGQLQLGVVAHLWFATWIIGLLVILAYEPIHNLVCEEIESYRSKLDAENVRLYADDVRRQRRSDKEKRLRARIARQARRNAA